MDVYRASQELRKCLELNDQASIDSLEFKLGLIHSTLYDLLKLPSEELVHLEEVKKQSISPNKWQVYLLSNLAKSYIHVQDYDAASSILFDWYSKPKDSMPNEILKTNYHNLGICYKVRNQMDSALLFQQKSLEIEIKEKDTSGIASSYMEIGNTLYEQYLDDSAYVYFIKAYELAKKIQDIDLMKYATLNMAVVEENAGNTSSALSYRKEYDGIRDSLDSRDKLWQIAKDEKEHAVSLKEEKIASVTQERENEKRKRNLILIIALGLLFLMTISIVLYRRSVKEKRIIESQRVKLNILNQTKNEILSIVSHDLKSPVHHIVLNNESLLKEFEKSNYPNSSLNLLRSNSELGFRTFQLIENLLNWALSQNDQFFFSKERIRLKRIIELVLYNLQPLLKQKDIQFENQLSEDIQLYMDLNSLKIVLRNIFDNAMKFTPNGGNITINLGKIEPGHICLIIKDSGIGMSRESIQKSLNEDKRFSKTDTTGKSSTGLGLGLCVSILRKNDGSITIQSEEGKGTVITLRLKKYEQV